MGRLLLVRHGQASWGEEDYDVLSETGREQARVVGAELAARGAAPLVVLHGALRRQRETAHLLAAAAGDRPTELDADWDEVDHESVLAAQPTGVPGAAPTRAELAGWFERAIRRWAQAQPGAAYEESFADFGTRVDRALARAVERSGAERTVVVVTSGGPIARVTAGLVAGGSDLPEAYVRLAQVVVNASVTKLVVGGRGARLVAFNEHTAFERPDRARLLTYR